MTIATHRVLQSPSGDRLVLTLFLATAFHALVILGISFETLDRDPPDNSTPTLDITVVQSRTEDLPEDYDYLADANQDGAGNTTEKKQPEPLMYESAVQSAPPPEPTAAELLTREESTEQLTSLPDPPRDEAPPTTSAAELVNRTMEMLTLNDQINQSLEAYSKTPQTKYISARTREFRFASYMRDWVAKVERVGELNFPDSARRARLSGNLIVEVSLLPDGSVRDITILRPSGHKILDDAAVRIVRLAAPFAPFPESIRKDTDVLHITRTWVFSAGSMVTKR